MVVLDINSITRIDDEAFDCGIRPFNIQVECRPELAVTPWFVNLVSINDYKRCHSSRWFAFEFEFAAMRSPKPKFPIRTTIEP